MIQILTAWEPEEMPIEVKCPQCARLFRLKDELRGKKFKCTECGEIVLAVPLKTASARAPASKPSSAPPKPKSASAKPAQQNPTPPRKKKKKKKRPANPFGDDYRDASPDDILGGSLDDFGDDYGEPYDEDPYADDPYGGDDDYAQPAPRRKSSKKKKSKSSSGSGMSIGFNLNYFNIGMTIGGIAIILVGLSEARLAAKSKSTPTEISLADLNTNGYGDNIYLTVSGISCILEETVVYGTETPGGGIKDYDKVWIPCVPAGSAPVGNNVHFLLYSNKAKTDGAVMSLARGGTYTGLVVNDVDPLSKSERQLLEGGFPGANLREAIILQVERTPSGAGSVVLYFIGGTLLSLGGLAWVFLGGNVASAPTQTRSRTQTVSSSGKRSKQKRTASLTVTQKLFSFQGRVNRSTFWLYGIGSSAGILVLAAISSVLLMGPDIAVLKIMHLGLLVAFLVLLSWIQIALQVKRWQDRGKPGIMVLISLIPLVGAIWVLVECGLLPGTPGSNEFGSEPA